MRSSRGSATATGSSCATRRAARWRSAGSRPGRCGRGSDGRRRRHASAPVASGGRRRGLGRGARRSRPARPLRRARRRGRLRPRRRARLRDRIGRGRGPRPGAAAGDLLAPGRAGAGATHRPGGGEGLEGAARAGPAEAIAIVHEAPAHPATPVVHFARPARPLGSGVDLGSRFASAGAGAGGFGTGGGGGAGWSLGSAFGKYVGGLRKVGLDVAIVVDATGSMQSIIDDLKRRMDDLAATLQRLVPTARVGGVAYRDRDEAKGPTGPRQSEDFVVKWTDLTFNVKKVQAFFNGLVAEGGGDWPEAVRAGLETAMRQMKWRSDAKKVIIIVG